MDLKTYYVIVVSLVSLGAILFVVSFAVTSICFVYVVKTVVAFIVETVTVLLEICIAAVAAVCSGITVSLCVLAAVLATSTTLPASLIEARIGVSILVSSTAILMSAWALFYLTSYSGLWEVEAAVIGAGAVAVSAASAWAVGVTSLIEKETQAVGVKLTSLYFSILDVVRQNKYNVLKIIVKLQVGLKQKDLNMALIYAVKAGFPDCVQVLLDNGADVNFTDSNNNTTLTIACDTGSERNVKILLDRGCDPNKRNSSRSTAMHYAARWGHNRCVDLLICHGARVDMQDGQWRTPLMLTCSHAHPAEPTMRSLINAGCDVNIMGVGDITALHYAASRGLDVTLLLDACADPFVIDADGNTPLHYASKEGCMEVVRELLKVGCDPQKTNLRGRTSLHLASERGEMPCIKTLIGAGADCDFQDLSGNLPIWYAAANGRFEAVRYFIIRNCPVHCTRLPGSGVPTTNPMLPSLEKKYFHIVKILVIAGCRTEVLCDWLSSTPEDCWWEDHIDIIHWLRDYLSQPISLAHACRLQIRASLGNHLTQKCEKLPLPTPLLKYISMEDLEKHISRRNPYSSFFRSDGELFDL